MTEAIESHSIGIQPAPPTSLEVGNIHANITPDLVMITEDRLALILHKHATTIEKSRAWIAPLGVCTTLVITLVTADFASVLLSADTWKAIFIVSLVMSFAWLLKELYELWKAASIDDLVSKIKQGR